MRVVRYAFREAASSLWRQRGASAFAIVAIALAIVVLGGILLLTTNVERLLADWSSAAEFSVYLRDDATSEQRGAIEAIIDEGGIAVAREYVSKDQAMVRFRRDFAELAALTASLETNPFPASVEVRVRPDAQRRGAVEASVTRLSRAPGVADVRYDRQWIERVTAGLSAVRRIGFALALVMLAAAALTVGAVVRLALHARRDELEVMQLVGSPYAYIRGPFVAEGLLQGGAGALLALLLLWLGFRVVLAWWGGELSAVVGPGMVRFLPVSICAALIGGGMIVGAAGGFGAARLSV
jgi:cell division transport system permease protein